MEKIDNLDAILKEIASKEIGDVTEIVFNTNCSKGQGYLGIVDAVDVKGQNGVLNLIVKTVNSDEKVREKIPLGQCVKTEHMFYKRVVPTLENFCNDKGVNDVFTSIPKSFWPEGVATKEVVILENLKHKGYEVYDRMKPMRREHVEMILKEYGRLHALSFAFKEERSEEFQKFATDLGDNIKNWNVIGMLNACIKSLEDMKVLIDGSMEGKVGKFIDGVEKFMLEHDFAGDDYAVILHGDCWCNNFMFKYQEDANIPESVKLIDFQISRIGPFVCDLVYFMGTCCDRSVWNNIEHYIRIYHAALDERMHALGTKKTISFDDVMKQFRKYAKYGLIIAAFLLRVTFIQEHEAPDYDDTINGRFIEKFIQKFDNEEVYTERMKFLVEYYCENNLLE